VKFLDRLRSLFEGPPHISAGGDDVAEVDDDLAEEMPVAQEDVDSLERAEDASGDVRVEPSFQPDIGPFENAEHEHDEPEPSPDVKP